MKKLLSSTLLASFALMVFASSVLAAPNPRNRRTRFFGYSDSWVLPIPHSERTPEHWYEVAAGWDLILIRGKSRRIHQWFIGDGYGLHSVWNISKNGKCKGRTVDLIKDPYNNGWHFDWFESGKDYCVRTNRFTVKKFPKTWWRWIKKHWAQYEDDWASWEAHLGV